MFRSWPVWLTLLLLSASLGFFWLLSSGLVFVRSSRDQLPKTAVEKPVKK